MMITIGSPTSSGTANIEVSHGPRSGLRKIRGVGSPGGRIRASSAKIDRLSTMPWTSSTGVAEAAMSDTMRLR